MPDPRRQLVGRRSKVSGETFERWISNACEFYLRNGWAHIEKTPEPFHITGKDRDGTVKGYYEKKGQPDYKGILCDGTGIMFEAKHTDGDRIRQNVVTDTQWESLDIYEKFGAHCYVMVSLGLTKFYITTRAYLLSTDTGLLEVPKRITISSESDDSSNGKSNSQIGYEVKYFLNGAIGVNDYIRLESDKVRGYFRVYKLTIDGDNLEGDWICTAQLLEVK